VFPLVTTEAITNLLQVLRRRPSSLSISSLYEHVVDKAPDLANGVDPRRFRPKRGQVQGHQRSGPIDPGMNLPSQIGTYDPRRGYDDEGQVVDEALEQNFGRALLDGSGGVVVVVAKQFAVQPVQAELPLEDEREPLFEPRSEWNQVAGRLLGRDPGAPADARTVAT
jgi:hypothetical protein